VDAALKVFPVKGVRMQLTSGEGFVPCHVAPFATVLPCLSLKRRCGCCTLFRICRSGAAPFAKRSGLSAGVRDEADKERCGAQMITIARSAGAYRGRAIRRSVRAIRICTSSLAASRCLSLPLAASCCPSLPPAASRCFSLLLAASRCFSLPLAASRCLSLPLAASRCLSLPCPALSYRS
jgi:hypothetical protein